MKKLKHFVRRTKIVLFFLISIAILILGLISSNVKTDLISCKLTPSNFITDSLIIHFIHGSIPKKKCPYQRKRLGGYLGGHIEIQYKDSVYGFLYDSLPINIFPCERFNSKFERKDIANWKALTKFDKITSIHIPITKEQESKAISIFESYLQKKPYDYAFFGQRCASSTAEILSSIGIFKCFSNSEFIISFFYPRELRLTMLKFANKNNLVVEVKNGIDCQRWE